MESEVNTKPIPLKPETRAVLDKIRRSAEPFLVYGMDPKQAEGVLKHITEPMLEGAALPMVILNQFRWYISELARVFRTRYGYPLAFQLELVMRKWVVFGMETNTMQFLLCEVVRQLGLMAAEGNHGRTRMDTEAEEKAEEWTPAEE